MNQFVVSARKYRPSTFDTVVGQSHITNTLKNAIRNKHLAQGFLFCGPRGVGKTTCARILAKTLNCRKVSESIEACNECDSCKGFNNGQSLNIYELDAASNNSVDDIRSLVEQVRYAPHSGEFKIYIIDEVHMLSPGAFNAFLKTLEEPPPYAIFILATTEKHKIIPTILSRCQIFDFNRIQVEDIATHLEFVSKSEGVTSDPDALHIIAQKADGALRDALSMFDQIVSFAGNNVGYKDVIDNLSILDYDYYFKITDDLRNNNIPSVLLTFNELLADGFDGHNFINGLASHFRDLLICQDVATIPLLEVSKNIRERYKLQASQTPALLLLNLLEICGKCDLEYRSAKNQRLHVELSLIRMCTTALGGLPASYNFPVYEKKSSEVNTGSSTPSPTIKPNIKISEDEKPAIDASVKSFLPPTNFSIVKEVDLGDDQYPNTSRPSVISPNAKVVESFKNEPSNPTPISNPVVSSQRLEGSLLKGTSLNLTNKQEPEKVVETNTKTDDLPSDKFEIEQLQKVWESYALLKQQEKKIQLFTVLMSSKPTMLDEKTIEMVIHNLTQNNSLQEEKQLLMDYLRKELNNYHLQLSTRIEENPDSKSVAYTNKERYQIMVEKNPDLDEFRKQLGLELE